MLASSRSLSPGLGSWARRRPALAVLATGLLAGAFSGGAFAAPSPPSPSAGPRFVGEREFKRLLGGEVPVVVEFWASWCAPCHHTSRQMALVAAEVAGRAAVVRVDVDREDLLAYRYRVESLPTVIVFRDGRIVHRTAGAVGADRLRSLVAAPAIGTDAPSRGVRPARAQTPAAGESFALVVNGDAETRHRDNVRIAVEALRRAGVAADRTYVLTAGPAAAIAAGHAFPPTWSGFKAALRELSGRVGDGDVVTVYVTGHAVDAPGTPLLLLADSEVAPAELARQLLRLRFGQMNFVADHCFSGAFTRTLQKLAGPGRGVVTVAATDPHHEVECALFARPFWRALGDRTADADGDGAVSVAEAYARAADALARSKGRDRAFAELAGANAHGARFAPAALEPQPLPAAR